MVNINHQHCQLTHQLQQQHQINNKYQQLVKINFNNFNFTKILIINKIGGSTPIVNTPAAATTTTTTTQAPITTTPTINTTLKQESSSNQQQQQIIKTESTN